VELPAPLLIHAQRHARRPQTSGSRALWREPDASEIVRGNSSIGVEIVLPMVHTVYRIVKA